MAAINTARAARKATTICLVRFGDLGGWCVAVEGIWLKKRGNGDVD